MYGTVIRSQFSSSHFEHPLDSPYVPAQQDRGPQGGPDQSDGSEDPETLFSMYLERTFEDDKFMVEQWKSTTDGILIFVSLQATSHTSTYN